MSDYFDKIQTLPSLTKLLKEHGIYADKKLGQNFLLDMNVTEKIAGLSGQLDGANIIEIGPGPGGLTRALLASKAKTVHAIEKDERFITVHQPLKDMFPNRFFLHHDDALKFDVVTNTDAPRVIVANLPYNVATPLLISWLRQIRHINQMILMFQQEVGNRILASPNNKTYGRLSVICQYLCHCQKRMTLPPSAFTPPPKVHSCIVELCPKDLNDDNIALLPQLEKVTAMAFGNRRKMLRSSLKPMLKDNPTLFHDTNIEETKRAENLTVEEFVRLAKKLT